MVVVRGVDDLERLPADRRVNGLARREELRFDIPGLALQRQLRHAAELNRLQRRCGCVAATLFFLGALALGGVWVAYTVETGLSLRFLLSLAAVAAAAVAVAVAAKLATMLVTRIQFRRACRALVQELQPGGEAPAG
jgi:hypothetical protein